MQGKIIVIIFSCLHMLSHIKAVGSNFDKNIHPSIKTWMLRAMYEVIECMIEFSLFCIIRCEYGVSGRTCFMFDEVLFRK